MGAPGGRMPALGEGNANVSGASSPSCALLRANRRFLYDTALSWKNAAIKHCPRMAASDRQAPPWSRQQKSPCGMTQRFANRSLANTPALDPRAQRNLACWLDTGETRQP
jgi:hypothetical protein